MGQGLPINRRCKIYPFIGIVLAIYFYHFYYNKKLWKKKKTNFFFFLKKVTKVLVIRKYRPINRRFILHITSWQQYLNEKQRDEKSIL